VSVIAAEQTLMWLACLWLRVCCQHKAHMHVRSMHACDQAKYEQKV